MTVALGLFLVDGVVFESVLVVVVDFAVWGAFHLEESTSHDSHELGFEQWVEGDAFASGFVAFFVFVGTVDEMFFAS